MIVTLTLKVNQVLGGGESGRRSCHFVRYVTKSEVGRGQSVERNTVRRDSGCSYTLASVLYAVE